MRLVGHGKRVFQRGFPARRSFLVGIYFIIWGFFHGRGKYQQIRPGSSFW